MKHPVVAVAHLLSVGIAATDWLDLVLTTGETMVNIVRAIHSIPAALTCLI